MIKTRILPAIVAALACACLSASAQSTPDEPAKPPTPAKSQAAPAKADAKKAEPKKAETKKKVEKKDEKATEKKPEKKAAPKPDAKKADAKKADAKAKAGDPKRASTTDPVIERYQAGKAPAIRDKDGNVIPTSPDAYNVDSARRK